MLKLPENIDYRDVRFPRGAFLIRKICENYKGGRIIDIGCGNGKNTKMLGKLGVDIVGVDIDEHEIKKAVESNPYENVQFACIKLYNITDTFSGIVLSEVLEHIEEPLDFLKEIYRLCENNGFLILTVPNGYCVKEIVMAAIRCLKKTRIFAKIVKWYKKGIGRDKVFNESPHLQRFTLKKIRSLIDKSGFTIEKEFYCDIWSGFLWMYFPWIPIPFFVKKFERRMTKYMPYYLLGDWGFLCLKKSQD